jgi:hypothetical protein
MRAVNGAVSFKSTRQKLHSHLFKSFFPPIYLL